MMSTNRENLVKLLSIANTAVAMSICGDEEIDELMALPLNKIQEKLEESTDAGKGAATFGDLVTKLLEDL